MKKAILIITLILIGTFLLGCTSSGYEVNNPLPKESFDASTICENESDFFKPICVSSIAFYNNDPTLCESITGDYEVEFTTGCKQTFENATFETKWHITGEGALLDNTEYYSKCEQACTSKDLFFIQKGKPYEAQSLNGMQTQIGDKTEKILSCFCFPNDLAS